MGGDEEEKQSGFGGWRRVWLFFIVGLVVSLLGFFAIAAVWPWSVTPPRDVQAPGVVYLTDYGRHSRLALQVDDHRMLEFSFGDWRYFALHERTVWRGFLALAFPDEAGLGRRDLPFVEDARRFNDLAGAKRSLRLEVERARIDELLETLHLLYEENRGAEVRLEGTGMTFVKVDESYHLLHNSNHRTAEWLRFLGCEISGSPILSNFRGRSPEQSLAAGGDRAERSELRP